MLPIVRAVRHAKVQWPLVRPETYKNFVHAFPTLGCSIRASGRYVAGEEELEIRGPFMGLMAAGERDGNGCLGACESCWVSFEWEGIQRVSGRELALVWPGLRIRRNHFRPLAAAELRTVVRHFRELLDLHRRPDPSSQLRAGAKVLELLAQWAQPPPAREGHERHVLLYRGLLEQYAEDSGISLEHLAQRVGMSAGHLGVLFRKELGMPPVEYRKRLRLLRARELLTTTARPVGDIAQEAGFPDANYFSRLFRKEYGMTPRQYAQTGVRVV